MLCVSAKRVNVEQIQAAREHWNGFLIFFFYFISGKRKCWNAALVMLCLDIGRFCANFFITSLKDFVFGSHECWNMNIKLILIITKLLTFRHIIKSRHKVTSICQQSSEKKTECFTLWRTNLIMGSHRVMHNWPFGNISAPSKLTKANRRFFEHLRRVPPSPHIAVCIVCYRPLCIGK